MEQQTVSVVTTIIGIIMTIVSVVLGVFQWAIVVMIKDVKEKMNLICEQNRDEHREMKTDNQAAHAELWKRLHHHKHDDCGNVVITGGE
ncbi:MAG: hypothetical protein ABFD81_02535 [Syntrophaceae bacterium]